MPGPCFLVSEFPAPSVKGVAVRGRPTLAAKIHRQVNEIGRRDRCLNKSGPAPICRLPGGPLQFSTPRSAPGARTAATNLAPYRPSAEGQDCHGQTADWRLCPIESAEITRSDTEKGPPAVAAEALRFGRRCAGHEFPSFPATRTNSRTVGKAGDVFPFIRSVRPALFWNIAS